jgi:hypothetical protein
MQSFTNKLGGLGFLVWDQKMRTTPKHEHTKDYKDI